MLIISGTLLGVYIVNDTMASFEANPFVTIEQIKELQAMPHPAITICTEQVTTQFPLKYNLKKISRFMTDGIHSRFCSTSWNLLVLNEIVIPQIWPEIFL